ncbi:MAG: barstar family protein [Candidatus Contendobacter sp.]|nr:barstar family protein [Candidatus Contendobacter sp.]
MNNSNITELSSQFMGFIQSSFTKFFLINGDIIEDKMTFLKEFSDKLKFPGYFGFNWDAFDECITDLSWHDLDKGFLIIYKNPHNFRTKKPDEWKIANDILFDAMHYWDNEKTPMILIFL